ncbi:MAG: ABC transporter substrate-binding protein [Lachnospiraceae bacterium]|nr:ABC transporter substrate-binding protein [Lachnospiraceae bacterium]
MKKRIMRSVASTLLLAFALSACGGNSGGEASTTPAAEASTAAEEASTAAEEASAATSEATEEEPAKEVLNQIIYGTTTEMNGDLGNAWWKNNAADKTLRDLIDDYDVVVSNQDGEFVLNESVAESMESEVNADGSKTFTVKIKEGLKFNNGDPITAADFCAYILVAISPAANEAGAKTSETAAQVMGGEAYMNGEVNYISGLKMLDEYTYSITINADYIPYYFDMLYASLRPISLKLYAPSQADIAVKDDGEGVYLDGGELSEDEINASRTVYEGRISAGPYQMESFDQASVSATVVMNPNYAGNFEGQKPSVERIIIVKAVQATMLDELATGGIDFLSALTGGDEVNAALDLEETGDFYTVSYDRAGYGKLMFQCDFGPTQFKAVRHAIAHLLDRNDFANTFTGGYGSVVHGPYGIAMWMYKDSKEELADRLDTYAYDVAKAIEILEEDGWVLGEDGSDYTDGIRYKEVTKEEAGDYAHNVTLADGRILMPLIIEWASSEGNSVSDLLAVMLANGDQVKEAGLQINQAVMTFEELLNYMYRDATTGDQYGIPTYGMYNLASNFTAAYSQAYQFVTEKSNPDYYAQGYNSNFTDSEELDKLSMDMVYGVEPGDSDSYLKVWVDFIDEWNDYLPEIPLYSNIYYDIMNSKINDLECNPLFDFQQAVVYAYIE